MDGLIECVRHAGHPPPGDRPTLESEHLSGGVGHSYGDRVRTDVDAEDRYREGIEPVHLARPAQPDRVSRLGFRYLGNDTHDGYTDPYMGWDQWQSMLDIYALHGINQVYVLPGTDAVYQQVLQDFGYTAEQTRA